MQRVLMFGLLCTLGLLSACQYLERRQAVVLETPNKALEYHVLKTSPSDDRSFRYVVLPNQLKLLLISDPDAAQAAVALDVNVGSRQDPLEYQGLAHFLEHMLFLGTAAYPEAGAYQKFINTNGGHTNAYTALENTNYFFDVNAGELESALDRFVQFFVAPLFNAQYVKREVNAVHSEYRARIQDDRRRYYDAMREVIDRWHPQAKFTVGSLDTLLKNGEEPLRQALLAFYKRYYSANLMSAVVSGPQSLDELQKLAVSRFAAVPNRNVDMKPIENPLFAPSRIPHWVNIQPLKDERSLTLHFPVPEVREHWRTKPLSYLGSVLGHEGKGSLLSYLKAKGWAESLSAGAGYEYQGGATFAVSIGLTEQGSQQRDQVVEAVFQMIALMREQSVAQWRYEEQAKLGEQAFRFRTQPDPINDVSAFASSMNSIPAPEEALRGRYLMDTYNYQLLVDYLSYLVARNVVVSHVDPHAYTDKKSQYYSTPYGERRIPPGLLRRWSDARPQSAMAMPAKNPFIAEQFALKTSFAAAKPSRLDSADGVDLWFKNDADFGTPKGRIEVLLHAPSAGDTPVHAAYTKMWLAMVNDQLNEFAYPANLAGLQYQISSSWRGIHLTVSGYDQRQAALLGELLSVLREPNWDWKRFQRLHTERARRLDNNKRREPYRRVGSRFYEVIAQQYWPLEQLIDAHRSATQYLVKRHAEQLLKQLSLSVLVHGNFTEFDAQTFAQQLIADLNISTGVDAVAEQFQAIPAGDYLSVLEGDHDDATLSLYVQAPEENKANRAAMGIAAQILRSEFYLRLRTQKQLGYIVGASPVPLRDISGLQFVVQSPVADVAQLRSEFEDFITQWLAGLNEKGFLENRDALVKVLSEAPQNLWAQGERYWQDIVNHEANFDSREQLIEAVQTMGYEQWLGIVNDTLFVESRRALWIAHWGKAGPKPFAARPVESLPSESFYRFP